MRLQYTFNAVVAGSTPARLTTLFYLAMGMANTNRWPSRLTPSGEDATRGLGSLNRSLGVPPDAKPSFVTRLGL